MREERTPQLVSLVGVPGIGKTRLARELVTAVEAEPDTATWLRGRCLPYGDGVSFAALAEMARTQAGILATDSEEKAAAKLRAAAAPDVQHVRRAGEEVASGNASVRQNFST